MLLSSKKLVFKWLEKKIECLASNQGVPRTKEENDLLKDHYFEFHIKCIPKKTKTQGDSVDDVIDVPKLKELSESLGKKLGIRIPLSYNGLRPSQRFLNTRTYGIGRDASLQKIDEIKNTINQLENVKVEKVIREYIVDDDNTALDAGWLEPKDYQNKIKV